MTGIFQDLEMVFQGMRSWISFLPRITFSNVTEIIILTILVYYALLWIKSTKAWYLLRGIAMIMAFAVAAAIFHWDTILWILGRTRGNGAGDHIPAGAAQGTGTAWKPESDF